MKNFFYGKRDSLTLFRNSFLSEEIEIQKKSLSDLFMETEKMSLSRLIFQMITEQRYANKLDFNKTLINEFFMEEVADRLLVAK